MSNMDIIVMSSGNANNRSCHNDESYFLYISVMEWTCYMVVILQRLHYTDILIHMVNNCKKHLKVNFILPTKGTPTSLRKSIYPMRSK